MSIYFKGDDSIKNKNIIAYIYMRRIEILSRNCSFTERVALFQRFYVLDKNELSDPLDFLGLKITLVWCAEAWRSRLL